jgi:hypothetical protein
MGPTEALVRLAELKGYSPRIDTLTASKRTVLVAVDRTAFRILPEGTQVRGAPNYKRQGLAIIPRAFRDDASYTLGFPAAAAIKGATPKELKTALERAPVRRAAYAAQIEKMCRTHPDSAGLRSFHRFLTSPCTIPTWLSEQMESTSPLFIPFWKGKPLFGEVEAEFASGVWTPPAAAGEELYQDVVTGEWTPVTGSSAPAIRGFGASTGVTFMSVNEPTTARNGVVGTAVKRLRAPVGEYAMNMHRHGFQWLVDRHRSIRIGGGDADGGNDGRIQIFFWTASGEPGVDDLFHAVLYDGIPLADLEARAAQLASREDILCVLGARESKRAQYVMWHCLPASEALANLLAFARARHRPDGRVLTIGDTSRAVVPLHLALDEDGSFNFKKLDERAKSRAAPSVLMALIDHAVDGQPFPQTLIHKVRITYATQRDTRCRGSHLHLTTQEALLE